MYARHTPSVTAGTEVRKIMTWPVATVEGDATLTEVAEALAADEIGALCVTEEGRLAGIVSERDVVDHVATGADPSHLTAADVMSNDLVTALPGDSVLEAALRMDEAQVRHLPVVEDGQIVGIISMRDLFTVLLDDVNAPASRGGSRRVGRRVVIRPS